MGAVAEADDDMAATWSESLERDVGEAVRTTQARLRTDGKGMGTGGKGPINGRTRRDGRQEASQCRRMQDGGRGNGNWMRWSDSMREANATCGERWWVVGTRSESDHGREWLTMSI